MTELESDEVDSCPACENEAIDTSVGTFIGVCESCGFAIQDDLDSISLEWEITDGTFKTTETRSWSAEYRVRNATEQQLADAFEHLEEIDDQLKLKDVVWAKSVDIYCDAFREKLTDGRETRCIIAASVYLASREEDIPIPIGRITDFQGITRKKFRLSYQALCEDLNLTPQTPTPADYAAFLESACDLTDEERRKTEDLLHTVKGEQAFIGKDPAGIAAAAVYSITEEVTQQEVAEAVGVSDETVRQRVNQLREVSDHV